MGVEANSQSGFGFDAQHPRQKAGLQETPTNLNQCANSHCVFRR